MKFNERLRKSRTNAGLSQDKLAKLCGVSKGMISQYENSEVDVDLSARKAIDMAKALSVDLEWLVTGKESASSAHAVRDGDASYNKEFSARHLSLLRNYLSLPSELRMPIRMSIEAQAFMLAAHPSVIEMEKRRDAFKKKIDKKAARKRKPASRVTSRGGK